MSRTIWLRNAKVNGAPYKELALNSDQITFGAFNYNANVISLHCGQVVVEFAYEKPRMATVLIEAAINGDTRTFGKLYQHF